MTKETQNPPVVISSFLERFQKAANKQKFALNNGGWGHAGWCNYQVPEGNGKGICNCGIVDLQSVLKDYEDYLKNGS